MKTLEEHTDTLACHLSSVRPQLIDDALDLARAGMLGYDTALSVLGYLGSEVEYLPWDAALNNLAYVNTQLKRTAGYGLFKVSAEAGHSGAGLHELKLKGRCR